MQQPTQWTLNDGWILASIHIYHDGQWSTLANIIVAADAMNHAIPTSGELTRALTRLHSHHVIERSQDGFRICESYRESLASALRGRGGLFDMPTKAKRWLTKTDLCIYKPVVVDNASDELTAAFQTYTASLRTPGVG